MLSSQTDRQSASASSMTLSAVLPIVFANFTNQIKWNTHIQEEFKKNEKKLADDREGQSNYYKQLRDQQLQALEDRKSVHVVLILLSYHGCFLVCIVSAGMREQ